MNAQVEFKIGQFRKNVSLLMHTCSGVTFLFPVKCCTEPSVLKAAAQSGLGFDVSNLQEYETVQQYCDGRIFSVSGPLSYELSKADYRYIFIASNSLSKWQKGFGLRINFNDDMRFEKSHFGVPLSLIPQELFKDLEYIHFHSSDTRTAEKCGFIKENIALLLRQFIGLKCLNIGGHLGDLSFEDGVTYINTVRSLVPENINLIVEAGDFLFKNCGILTCQALDVYFYGIYQNVILNFSKVAHQRWVHPTITSCNRPYDLLFPTCFWGGSCCEGDIFLETKYRKTKHGEVMQFHNISPYSGQWNCTFNGMDKINFYFTE